MKPAGDAMSLSRGVESGLEEAYAQFTRQSVFTVFTYPPAFEFWIFDTWNDYRYSPLGPVYMTQELELDAFWTSATKNYLLQGLGPYVHCLSPTEWLPHTTGVPLGHVVAQL